MYQMRWWGHVRRRERSHPLRAAARLRAQKLRCFRPGFTWWDCILQNMQRYGDMSLNEWKELATDREKFHVKLRDIFEQEESEDRVMNGINLFLFKMPVALLLFI